MHLLSSWPEIKKSTYRIKNFYLRAIGLIIASTDYTDIKLLLTHIFTVCLYETDGLNSYRQPTKCEISKTYLKRRIATHVVELNEFLNYGKLEDNEPNEDYNKEIIAESPNTSIFLEFKMIFENVKNEANNDDEGDHDNMQYNPNIAKKLLDFCKLIPTWSAIMVPIFKYGNITETSSTSESLFNDLKTNVFKHKSLPLTIDQFLKMHVNSIIGSMNIIGNTLGATKSKIEYDSYLTNKNDEVIINEQSDNSGNNVNTHDCFVYNIEENDENENEFHLEVDKYNENVNEFNLEVENCDENVNEFNLEVENCDENVNEFNLKVENCDENVN